MGSAEVPCTSVEFLFLLPFDTLPEPNEISGPVR